MIRPWESLIVGFIGGAIANTGCTLLERMRIDDPVGCVATHFFTGGWGLIVVGLLVEKDSLENFSSDYGVLKGGHWKLLGIQLLALVSMASWSAITTFLLVALIDKVFFTFRMPLHMELDGADKWEHGILGENIISGTENGLENPGLETGDESIPARHIGLQSLPQRILGPNHQGSSETVNEVLTSRRESRISATREEDCGERNDDGHVTERRNGFPFRGADDVTT